MQRPASLKGAQSKALSTCRIALIMQQSIAVRARPGRLCAGQPSEGESRHEAHSPLDEKQPHNFQGSRSDAHITERFVDFDPASREARLAIDKHHPSVGVHLNWFDFESGDGTRIDGDEGDPDRDARPIVESHIIVPGLGFNPSLVMSCSATARWGALLC
jgi:hypothetical protein